MRLMRIKPDRTGSLSHSQEISEGFRVRKWSQYYRMQKPERSTRGPRRPKDTAFVFRSVTFNQSVHSISKSRPMRVRVHHSDRNDRIALLLYILFYYNYRLRRIILIIEIYLLRARVLKFVKVNILVGASFLQTWLDYYQVQIPVVNPLLDRGNK